MSQPSPVSHTRRSPWRPVFTTLLAPVLLATALVSAADAATLYVAPNGSDSNPGTESQPFRTIQRAANVVNPGDTVIVEDGIYTGTGVGTSCASSTSRPVVCLSRGGTSSAWVTFRARNPLGAKVNGDNNRSTHGFRFLSSANYIRVEGFDVYGMGSSNSGVSAFQIYSGGHDVEIVGNAIHDIGRLCTDHVYGMSAVFIQNARVTVAANLIYNIGRFAPGEQGCQTSTSNYQNHDHGIYVNGKSDGYAPGARDIHVVNNRFSNIQRGWPVQVYPDPVNNLQILHNTFAMPNPYRNGHVLLAASTSNSRIANNVFYEPTLAGINFSSGTHTQLTVTHNLSSRNISTSQPSGVTFTGNIANTDPQVSDADYIPYPTSPAIDRGLTLAEVTKDINGASRPYGAAVDIGADEYRPAGGGSGGGGGGGCGCPEGDTTAPTVTITAPSANASVKRKVSLAADATDNVGVVTVEFFVDGALIRSDPSSPYTATWNSNGAAKGPHTVSVTATDAAGNQKSASLVVILQ